jgi:hypothetical protein
MSIFDFFLIFSKEIIILPLSTLLLIKDHKKYISAILLLLISGLYSYCLKNIFSIPYNQETILILGKNGLSFPSGHMLSSICFYGYILYISQNKAISLTISFILFGIGSSLIFNKYHDIYDILGSIFFGLIALTIYIKIINFIKTKYNYDIYQIKILLCVFIFMILLFIVIVFYELNHNHIKSSIILSAMMCFLFKKDSFIILYCCIIAALIYLFGNFDLFYLVLIPFVLRLIINRYK